MINTIPFIIDTDPGVDDALVLAWLHMQPVFDVDILGIEIVADNTSALYATHNALTVFPNVNRPKAHMAMGVAQPQDFSLSQSNNLFCGLAGLWEASQDYAVDGYATAAPAISPTPTQQHTYPYTEAGEQTGATIESSLEAVNLLDLSDVALSCSNIGVINPEPQAYEHIEMAKDFDYAKALFIDATPVHMEGAHKLSMHAYLLGKQQAQNDLKSEFIRGPTILTDQCTLSCSAKNN